MRGLAMITQAVLLSAVSRVDHLSVLVFRHINFSDYDTDWVY